MLTWCCAEKLCTTPLEELYQGAALFILHVSVAWTYICRPQATASKQAKISLC